MSDVYIIGSFMTPFQRWPDKDHRKLAREAISGVIEDAGLADGLDVEQTYFGSCLMQHSGQTMVTGQACLLGLMEEGILPERMPIFNVEAACATGSVAMHLARNDILTGSSNLALAVGVEKMFNPANPQAALHQIEGAMDQFDRQRWMDAYSEAAKIVGFEWAPSPDRSMAMDTYGVQASLHMHHYGTTREQIAMAAAKSHNHGSLNPKAQYQFPMTPEEVLADRPVSGPLTRAMCAPIGDGAAAAILCSEKHLRKLPKSVQERAVRIRATAVSGGKFRSFDEPGLSRIAGDKAYEMAKLSPDDIDLAEVHDATSFSEIFQSEMLRFCPTGKGGEYVSSGATALGGERPMNTSGGLVSKGHPIAATGLSMVNEIVTQVRGEAGKRQVKDANIGLLENGGGVLGMEEAICVVAILEGTRT